MSTEKIEGAAKVSIELDLSAFVANTWQDNDGEYHDSHNSPRDQIIERAAQMIREDIGKDLAKDIRAAVAPEIEVRVRAIVEETLAGEFRPVNQWGETTTHKTSLREQISKEATDWLTKKADRYGNGPSNLQSVVKAAVDRQLTKDFAEIIADEKAKIVVQLRAAAAELLAKEAAKR